MKRRLLLQGSLSAAGLAAAASGAEAAVAATAPARTLQVEAVQMPAWIEADGQRRPLAPGDTVSTAQEVETGANAALVMRLPEGSLVRLGEKSRLAVPQLSVAQEQDQTVVRSQLKLTEGFFRFTTSAVAKAVGRREIDVTLRTATIGIRGTDFWSMTDAVHDAACLFEGRIELATRDQGALVLDKPTAFWARFFERPVQPVGNATPDELARFLRSTEPQPGRGIAVAGGRWRVVAGEARDAAGATALAQRLRRAGYPAQVRARGAVREVHIAQLATREDAAAVLQKIAGIAAGVQGRVARAA
ncbi:FecR domain-containing protein [Ramlibacter tataouinensis]|uniref:SPOR domain-containing protein n=1 Tax=Ramlibacter tataouinensis (strain ATCC BAA-407 / DSM 14655 / LMG 21543 / TTB310) TaxID=365046 RepID=F5Y1G0_RAMTT|nr:FecR domain-containing protein [Ramlibacter tataouinensis]AEG94744.1 Hypothetical protein Rta_36290 [Ramlibacter tataouinensis TTB310]